MTHETYDLSIRLLGSSDIVYLVEAFQKADWPKPTILFETYHQEQLNGDRLVWVAFVDKQIAGYVTLVWDSKYKPFFTDQTPEIMDLNVLPLFRKIGIGTKLLETAEKEAFTKHNQIGIGVGLYGGSDGGYGTAQRLYIKRGYSPDGKGVTYNYQPVTPGKNYPVDDSLCLWFTKELK